jgi:hypothetical protein
MGETLVLSVTDLRTNWEQTSIEEWEAASLKFEPPARPEVPPDLVGAVYGFRAWQLDAAGYLTSQGQGNTTWEAGRNVAVCVADFADGHRAPLANCGCGLYAYHDPRDVELVRFGKSEAIPVAGIVRAWGDMEVHHAGIRAEYAEIVALCTPVQAMIEEKGASYDLAAALKRAVGRYGVEVIEPKPKAMRAWVESQTDGDVVPEEMRPELDTTPNDIFWAPPMTLSEGGLIRINGRPRARGNYEIEVLSGDKTPEEREGMVMYVGEVCPPGHSKKHPAVVYIKLDRSDRFILKYDRAVSAVMLFFCLLFFVSYVWNFAMSVSDHSVFFSGFYIACATGIGYLLPFWFRRVKR